MSSPNSLASLRTLPSALLLQLVGIFKARQLRSDYSAKQASEKPFTTERFRTNLAAERMRAEFKKKCNTHADQFTTTTTLFSSSFSSSSSSSLSSSSISSATTKTTTTTSATKTPATASGASTLELFNDFDTEYISSQTHSFWRQRLRKNLVAGGEGASDITNFNFDHSEVRESKLWLSLTEERSAQLSTNPQSIKHQVRVLERLLMEPKLKE